MGTATIFEDAFTRSAVDEPWAKDAGNPLTGAGYGDPFLWYEGGYYYLFADDLTADTIVVWKTTDYTSLGSPSTILSPGTTGAWDGDHVRDCFIVKVSGTYYLFYSGQTDSSPTGITHKIGYATSSTIDGTYTKYGSNPVIDRSGASHGTNEPSVDYDPERSPAWRLYATEATIAEGAVVDDVGVGVIAHHTASTPTSWTLQGDVITGSVQDQEQVPKAANQIPYSTQDLMYYNTSSAAMAYAWSTDGSTWAGTTNAGVVVKGAGGSWDDAAVYAPSLFYDGSQWVMLYQGNDGADNKIGVATRANLHGWQSTDSTYFEVSSNKLRKKASNTSSWELLFSTLAFDPDAMPEDEYTVTVDIYFESEDDGGYICGVQFGESATYQYGVIFDPSANTMALWENNWPSPGSHSSLLDTDNTQTMNLTTWYKIRATVTKADITIDWYDGSTWQTGLMTASKTFILGRIGFYGYANGSANNYTQFDNLSVTAATSGIAPHVHHYKQAGGM